MKNPSVLQRGLFIVAIGFLFVGMLFTITEWPAAELFTVLGGLSATVLYIIFSHRAMVRKASDYARHATFGTLVAAIVLKSFGVGLGTYFFLIAFVAFLIWFTWSVLEDLPPSEN